MKLEKVEEAEQIPTQAVRYTIIEQEIAKGYVDGKDVQIQSRNRRTITEAQVNAEILKWQELKDKIVALKK